MTSDVDREKSKTGKQEPVTSYQSTSVWSHNSDQIRIDNDIVLMTQYYMVSATLKS